MGLSIRFFLLSLFLFCSIDCSASPENTKKGRVRLTVDRESEASLTKLKIVVGVAENSEVNVFALDNPIRLVLDASAMRVKREESFRVPGSPSVSQIRVGAHKDKLRIVIDITSKTLPKYSWKKEKGEVQLTLEEPNSNSKTITAPVTPTYVLPSATPTRLPTATMTPKPTKTSYPTPTATKIAHPTETVTPTQTPQPSATEAPTKTATAVPTFTATVTATAVMTKIASSTATAVTTPDSKASWILSEIRFDYLNPGKVPIIKLLLSAPRARVQMTKVDQNTYRLTIREADLLAEHLTLPQYPPADFSGFTLLQAKRNEEGIELTVKVTVGTAVGAFVRNNEVWMKKL